MKLNKFFFALTLLSNAHLARARIQEISSLAEIYAHIDRAEGLLIAFDIDNTLAVTHKEQYIGNDEWFFHTITKKQLANQHDATYTITHAIDETLPLYYAIQHKVSLYPIEPTTSAVVNDLLKKHWVIALTSRGEKLIQRTRVQLQEIGIDFNPGVDDALPHDLLDISTPGFPPSFYWRGMIFCNGHHKGKTLLAFLSRINKQPTKVIFIDDKLKYLHDVEKALATCGIEFVGLRYNACDGRLDTFDHAQAEAQLAQFLKEHGHATQA